MGTEMERRTKEATTKCEKLNFTGNVPPRGFKARKIVKSRAPIWEFQSL
jgi:hypothetical protein